MPVMRIAAAQADAAWLDSGRTTGIVTDWIGRAADIPDAFPLADHVRESMADNVA